MPGNIYLVHIPPHDFIAEVLLLRIIPFPFLCVRILLIQVLSGGGIWATLVRFCSPPLVWCFVDVWIPWLPV